MNPVVLRYAHEFGHKKGIGIQHEDDYFVERTLETKSDKQKQMKKFEELVVTLDTFAFEGKSIARVDGFVVFVDGGVPGDEVRVNIRKVKKQHAEASVVEVLKKSILRVEPPCPHFGTCGGCKWQHVGYQAQLDFKRQHVIDALERIGGFTGMQVNPTIGSEDVYFYRN